MSATIDPSKSYSCGDLMVSFVAADSTMLKDVWVPLIIALLGAAIATLWPWLQSLQRGQKFQRLIRRELEEIAPFPDEPRTDKPWWEHATRRFVHEEFFRRSSVPDQRDFLLSLDPTVVYQVSQLWIALEKRDGRQWLWFLGKLAGNPKTSSIDLQKAHKKWARIIEAQRPDFLDTMGTPTPFRQEAVLARLAQLFDKRVEAYARLLPLTDVGPEGQARRLDVNEGTTLATSLREWYYREGAGLLLSGRSSSQFETVRNLLQQHSVDPDRLRAEFSKLRTDLKIDLGVRQPQERDVAMPWPEDERW
jgi:hypothetical protein